MNFKLILIALCLVGTAAGVGTAVWLDADSSDGADVRPAFSLPDMQGKTRHIDEWDGRWLLVNFWATWCKPCREEIPLLIDAQSKYGQNQFQILGLALDDPKPVAQYAAEMQINYPILVDAMGVAKVQDAYGGGAALPYSVLISPDQRMVESHRGELKPEQLAAWLQKHLPEG